MLRCALTYKILKSELLRGLCHWNNACANEWHPGKGKSHVDAFEDFGSDQEDNKPKESGLKRPADKQITKASVTVLSAFHLPAPVCRVLIEFDRLHPL